MDIQKIPFFQGIETSVAEAIVSSGESQSFEAGQNIFTKGASADYLYILKQGSIDLILKQEGPTIFPLTEPGEVFGWSSLVEKGVYTSTSTCTGPSTVLQIPKDKIEAIFEAHPKAAIKFYQRLGSIFSRRIAKATE